MVVKGTLQLRLPSTGDIISPEIVVPIIPFRLNLFGSIVIVYHVLYKSTFSSTVVVTLPYCQTYSVRVLNKGIFCNHIGLFCRGN